MRGLASLAWLFASQRCVAVGLSVSLVSPPGHASQIRVTGVSCAQERRLVAGTPAKHYLRRGGRFRAGGLYCGTQRDIGLDQPALFERSSGSTDILFDVS